MNLSLQEQKMIARLRQKQRFWRWGKWVFLIEGIIVLVTCVFGFTYLAQTPPNEMPDLILFFLFYPVLLSAAIAGTILLGTAIRDWRGNTTDTLLLKLLDEQSSPHNSADS